MKQPERLPIVGHTSSVATSLTLRAGTRVISQVVTESIHSGEEQGTQLDGSNQRSMPVLPVLRAPLTSSTTFGATTEGSYVTGTIAR